ncbi:hypothetical protein HYDPIDRAFT_24053 [Hydnomerulius pinastri MD-312]|nr:hypothetical protein HYDPIDRAFT_24053 [Hydnomerulius pinastri MD-312]
MSSESSFFSEHEVHEIALLATQISSDPLSLNSCVTNSHKLLIPESSLSSSLRSSTCSSPRCTPTVKFAPLPQTDPTRTRSLAPLGVSARSRRRRAASREGGSVLWATDPDSPEEIMEDPLITFGRFVKNASKHLWRRVRKRSTVAQQEKDDSNATQPVIEITADEDWGYTRVLESGQKGGRMMEIPGGEEKLTRRASWSSSTERRTLDQDDARRQLRRSTGNLLPHSVLSEVAL